MAQNMLSGKRAQRRQRWQPASKQCGVVYLGMLIALAVIGIGLSEAGVIWAKVRQRERETELLFVGQEFRQAIERYYLASPGSQYPRSLDALVEDKRSIGTRHHLRRIYADPLTGRTDWGVVKAPDGGIAGVYSLAPGKPVKKDGFSALDTDFSGKSTYQEWLFVFRPDKGKT